LTEGNSPFTLVSEFGLIVTEKLKIAGVKMPGPAGGTKRQVGFSI